MPKTRVMLVDDHAVLRNGMRHLIEAEPDMEVVAEADDGTHVVELVEKMRPEVVVMDLSMQWMGGVEATRRLRQAESKCSVLILTVHEDRSYLREAIDAGAQGFVLKRAAADELIGAIRAIASGKPYIDSRIATKLVSALAEPVGAKSVDAPELAQRELEVLRYIACGYSNKEIGAMLLISVKTVETYKARSMKKLGLRSRVDIVRMARERKWAPVSASLG